MNQPEKPHWLKRDGLTFRQWKQQKRAQLEVLQRAFDQYQLGCAYCPGYDEGTISRISDGLKRVRYLQSQQNWGR